jgi:hypothetical protein
LSGSLELGEMKRTAREAKLVVGPARGRGIGVGSLGGGAYVV